jgi:hypothetical protein
MREKSATARVAARISFESEGGKWGIAVFAVQHFLHTSFAICAGLPRINEASHTVAAVQHQVFRSARCSCVCDAPTEEAL